MIKVHSPGPYTNDLWSISSRCFTNDQFASDISPCDSVYITATVCLFSLIMSIDFDFD